MKSARKTVNIKYNGEQEVEKVIPVQAVGFPGVSSQIARQMAHTVVRSAVCTAHLYRPRNISATHSC